MFFEENLMNRKWVINLKRIRTEKIMRSSLFL
jgi:hypothetical protein